jgi:predicted TIM-barrel fold metal-dependent hydrolase
MAEDLPSPLVDAHHHLWNLARHIYPWLADGGVPATTDWIGNYAAIRSSYGLRDYLTDAAGSGLIKSVHVEASWGGRESFGETAWLQSLANERGFPQAIVAAVDLRATDAQAQIERHVQSRNLRGIRMTQMGELVSRADFRRGFASVAAHGLSYDLNIRYEDVRHALALATAFPETPILVDNMANPVSLDAESFIRWRAAMRQLAAAPNVAMKISGLGMADHCWTIGRIRPWILAAVDLFEPARCMFGSNWPVDSLYGTYAELVDAFRAVISELDQVSQNAMLFGTAERLYRI